MVRKDLVHALRRASRIVIDPGIVTLRVDSNSHMQVEGETTAPCYMAFELKAGETALGQMQVDVRAKDLLAAVLMRDDEEVAIAHDKGGLLVDGAAWVRVTPHAPGGIPGIDDVEASIMFSGDALADALDRVNPCVLKPNHGRPQLQGVHLDYDYGYLAVVATDTFVLGYDRIKCNKGPDARLGLTIPTPVVREAASLIRGDDAVLAIGNKLACIHAGAGKIFFPPYDGQYPDYRRIIPKDPPHLIAFKRDILETAVRRCAAVRDATTITLQLAEKQARFSSASDSMSYAEEIPWGGKSDTVCESFDVRRLAELISRLPEGDVIINWTEPQRAWRFMTTGQAFYIVMPVTSPI